MLSACGSYCNAKNKPVPAGYDKSTVVDTDQFARPIQVIPRQNQASGWISLGSLQICDINGFLSRFIINSSPFCHCRLLILEESVMSF
jgi:hypothetical protein